MGHVITVRVFYGIIIKEDVDVEKYELEEVPVYCDEDSHYITSEGLNLEAELFGVIEVPTAPPITNSKFIRLLEMEGITKFKGPAWFVVGDQD